VIGVDGADAVFARGLELGGTEAVRPEDLQGVGRVGYLRDPDGNVFGVISEVLSDGTSPMSERAVDLEAPMHGERQAIDPMQATPEP